ncbi:MULTISPECIES: Asp23/Gls24 family envelope stress response protein [Nocardia]|uniref:Asp23/Gls24 family envelope stress response protein n=1 Tax=Nocardia farcinica TaxID=37329 RepID=A0A0H5NM42_NOCFR|nr:MULTISPECIES: Asp23/Gls24 family envelope stress response protein [Nocardia]MBA4855532.1 Asp23/Gls24 family envelope stress response protein [Nocardia farcinica]MBC9818129.1 Asp23/Gls24 family envelope stress response protein [Nocardia farcinica]MBF6184619.1 Asp23/Gls24 family envelope stress response protein [Nocardia farcinica]MBF6247462.1 Asp23/Gls24 family envelope stress response protein [Nocardia elegans]MBF6255668.1 Asp23/Gls24 family envelope stress response protein [Nocardia farcin
MAVNDTTEQNYVLPCGRDIEQVWERLDMVRAGFGDEHDMTCEYCRGARESLLALRAATAELIEEPTAPPPDLVTRIMSAVRAEARRGRTLRLATDQPGAVEVSEQAVAAVLRYAADTVPGVRARHCAVRELGAEPDGTRRVTVELSIAVRFPATEVGRVLPAVRERVRTALAARTGLVAERIDVVVADVFDESPREGR